MSGVVTDSAGRIVLCWAPNRWDLLGLWRQYEFRMGRIMVGELIGWFSVEEVS